MKDRKYRFILAIIGFIGLGCAYLYQDVDVLFKLSSTQFHPYIHFIVKKSTRLILNDVSMLLLIFSLFQSTAILRLALFIQFIDLFVLLPIYLILKLSIEGDTELSVPILSQLHRLIVNPTLMILLVPAVYLQRHFNKNEYPT
jgi:exosortase F-associated protein